MKLNLGCGFRKMPGYINIDNRPEVSPDLVCDLTKGIPYKDSSIEHVRAVDFLEHIPIGKTVQMIEEIYRVLRPGGMLSHFTPSTDGRGAFQDPTHVSFWNKNSWLYYMDDAYRNLYGIKAKFRGDNKDILTDKDMHIVHTTGHLKAVKEQNDLDCNTGDKTGEGQTVH